MRLVILESPFHGRTETEAVRNKKYAAACMLDSLRREESPMASHLLWPGILDDSKPEERAAGIAAGLAWGRVAEATVVYMDLGISPGMRHGIEQARKEGRPVQCRSLPGWGKEEVVDLASTTESRTGAQL